MLSLLAFGHTQYKDKLLLYCKSIMYSVVRGTEYYNYNVQQVITKNRNITVLLQIWGYSLSSIEAQGCGS